MIRIVKVRQSLFWWYWFPVVAYAVAIFIQSSFPAAESLPSFDFSDKLFHLMGYGLMGMLLFRAFSGSTRNWRLNTIWVASAALAALYGASDEIHQSFVPSRSADVLDFLADAIGALLGAGAVYWIERWRGLSKI